MFLSKISRVHVFYLKIIRVHIFCPNFSQVCMFFYGDNSKLVQESTQPGGFPG